MEKRITKVYIKNCKQCNKVMVSQYGRRNYCNSSCRRKYKYLNYDIPKHPKKEPQNYDIECVVCKTDFKSSRKNSKFCSDKCRAKNRRKSEIYTKVCPTCGKGFQTTNKLKTYCKSNHSPANIGPRKLRKRRQKKAHLSVESWKVIDKFIQSRPEGMELDHIIPLNHPEVCGLHNTWNFQWLTKEENTKKSNSFDGTAKNNSWKNFT
jgi:hypothetical protein